MSEEAKSNRLGRGLSALLGETDFDAAPTAADPMTAGSEQDEGQVNDLNKLPIEFLKANPLQPRKVFEDDSLAELAQSIKEKGVLQPIIVRPLSNEENSYQIVAGERRWRASQIAALHEVPVIIRELSDLETLEIALIENLQRSDLNPIEEAEGYSALMEEFDYTQEKMADEIGKSRSHVANMVRLLGLPSDVKGLISDGTLSAGHGRAILSADDPASLAGEIVKRGLNVRQAEALAKGKSPSQKGSKQKGAASLAPALGEKDADTLALEDNVSGALGLRVEVNHKGEAGGQVVVTYKTLEQLDEVCRRLSRD